MTLYKVTGRVRYDWAEDTECFNCGSIMEEEHYDKHDSIDEAVDASTERDAFSLALNDWTRAFDESREGEVFNANWDGPSEATPMSEDMQMRNLGAAMLPGFA